MAEIERMLVTKCIELATQRTRQAFTEYALMLFLHLSPESKGFL